MDSSEEQFKSLSQQIEQREQLARRRAWLITLIPIILAVLFLTYTLWQIAQAEEQLSIRTSQLAAVEDDLTLLRTQVPEAQATFGSVQVLADQLQTELSQARTEVAEARSALATATAQLSETQKELDAARVFAQNTCPLDETVLKNYVSDYTPQAQVLIYLMEAQRREIPWNPGGFSETDGFNSPDFALFVLQNAVPGLPLVSPDYQPGTAPWQILQPTSRLENGDIIYYQSGYTMFYYKLPVGFASRKTIDCVIGMTPLGVISQEMGFAEELGALKVPYR